MSDSAVPPLGDDFQRLNQQVYAALLSAIAERRFRPGQRLVLDDLAAQLRVSRTPIRVALSRLAAEGLVQPSGRMGVSVTKLSGEELRELYDVRLMCECYAVETGIGNVTPCLVEQMEEVLIRSDQHLDSLSPEDRLAHVLKDQQFHRLIMGLAHNSSLVNFYERLNIHIHGLRVGPLPISPDERREANNAEHRAIISALGAGDASAAKAAVSTHIRNSASRAILAMDMDKEAGTLTS